MDMMRIIYRNIVRAAATAAAVLSLNSCLEKNPGDYILIGDGMASVSDAEQTVNGIYKAMMSGALYSGYLTVCQDIQADLVYAVQGNSNTYGNIWQWDILSTNSEVESVYAGLYTVIGR